MTGFRRSNILANLLSFTIVPLEQMIPARKQGKHTTLFQNPSHRRMSPSIFQQTTPRECLVSHRTDFIPMGAASSKRELKNFH